MPPKRRETDAAKQKRDEEAQRKHDERVKQARPLTEIEAKLLRPRFNASGRLSQ